MVVSLPDPSRTRALLLALLLIPAVLPAASPRALPRGTDTDRVINLDADSQEVDFNTNHAVFRNITISQGGTSISANEAEADGQELKFDGSNWEFRGNVRIRSATTRLDADNATISFKGERIARAQVRGKPAQFEQKLEKTTAQGKSNNIDYEVAPGRVTLAQGYWFSDGRNEWRSDTLGLIYSVREGRVQSGGAAASPNGGGRIHITIRPDENGAATPTESPAP